MSKRSAQAIRDRIESLEGEDLLGFHRQVLIGALTFEEARDAGYLVPDATGEEWKQYEGEYLTEAARDYLDFAIGKMLDHRGISASRSVDKLTEFAWLMGRDDVVTAMGAANYENYGAPKVKAFADGLGWSDVWSNAAGSSLDWLERMASGQSCYPGCEEGCGR